jgi:hypothetical protein
MIRRSCVLARETCIPAGRAGQGMDCWELLSWTRGPVEGHTYDEMAVKLNCSKRTVIRNFKLICQIAEAGE